METKEENKIIVIGVGLGMLVGFTIGRIVPKTKDNKW